MTGSALTRHRRGCAVLVAALWLLGVEVMPNVHLAEHRADHTHAADGTVIAHEHDHDRDHDHDAAGNDLPRGLAHTGQLAIDRDTPDHDAAGLAHHALALHAAPPAAIARYVPHDLRWDVAHTDSQLTSTGPARPTARGPPAT